MKIYKTDDGSHGIDDQFLASLFGTDNGGADPLSDHEFIGKIRSGIPSAAITTLSRKIDVSQKDVAAWLHTTPRTIQRSIEAGSPLGLDLSDRVSQLIRVYRRCRDVFKEDTKVSVWLKTPNYALGNSAPAALLDTIRGMELVLDELGRIEHGVFI